MTPHHHLNQPLVNTLDVLLVGLCYLSASLPQNLLRTALVVHGWMTQAHDNDLIIAAKARGTGRITRALF